MLIRMQWLYIIYLVAKNRYFPTSVESLRDSIRRASDREGVAYGLGELIDRHGREDWLEPLTEALGPYIQLQLGDIANMLEVFAKFVASNLKICLETDVRTAFTRGRLPQKQRAPSFSSYLVSLYLFLQTLGFA